ncbi:cytochrome P450 [Actinomadura sp. 9N215]|uniref:cytochrome P450 n=1 Tax=Actinomadura sp. 9N215 TaxID=3375150 RepID=UPI00378B8875
MRITTPAPADRIDLDDVDLADPMLYTRGDAHLAWQTLRAERPVFWQRRRTGPGFWAVTRYADVRRVLRDHETFGSEHGTSITMIGVPDPGAGRMMQSTDPPRHRGLRGEIGRPLAPRAVGDRAETIRSLVRRCIEPARDGGVWDAAAAFTRMTGQIAARFMEFPDDDVDRLLSLSYATQAPLDPHYRLGSQQLTLRLAHHEIMSYFAERLRARPRSGLLAHLTGIEIDGRRLTHEELLLNCHSLIVAFVMTTAQTASTTMIALAGQGGGEGRWPPGTPMQEAVEEALRWASPATHFVRQARRDVELHGVKIKAGEPVTAWLASANRDPAVFARPYALDLGRSPNRHVAFGSGPHRCVGAPLARLVLATLFEELFAHIESFELAGDPEHLVSNEIGGIVGLPLRVRPRPGGPWA